MSPKTSRTVAAAAGLGLVVGFFLPVLDVGGMFRASGWDIVTSSNLSLWTRVLWALIPIGGLALVGSATVDSKAQRPIAITMGLGILGYSLYKTVQVFLATTGLGLWLVLAAAVAALVAGVAARRR